MDYTWLWIPATIAAAAAQSGRNIIQSGLTRTLGTLGATQVRFLYGFPFALLFLLVLLGVTGASTPALTAGFLAYAAAGAATQIAATALMLAAMRDRGFVVVTAWIKTEPIQVAVFGLIVLGDPFSWITAAGIVLATLGVVLLSVKPSVVTDLSAGMRPVALGLLAGACFALSAIGFRGAILTLETGSFLMKASWTLTWSLGMQAGALLAWMLIWRRDILQGCLRAWRASIGGGFLGAFASQCWFIGFALTAAANVRTLGLIEVLFALLLAQRLSPHRISRREGVGIATIILGAAIVITAAQSG